MTESQNQGNPTPETEPEPNATPEPAKPEARWTDKDMDKQKGGARKEGRNTGRTEREQEILEATGIESVDDLVELAQAFKTVEEESATEADTERKAREKAEAKLQALEEKAQAAEEARKNDLIRYELRDALKDAEVHTNRIPKIVSDTELPAVTVEGTEVKGVDAFIEAAKGEYPEWFGNAERKPSGFDGVPPGDPNGASEQQKQENQEIAKRQIHRMF